MSKEGVADREGSSGIIRLGTTPIVFKSLAVGGWSESDYNATLWPILQVETFS